MTSRSKTQLGAPGPRPLGGAMGGPANGHTAAPAGTTSLTLGTLREVRNELASLGDLLERMSKEMSGLRRAVEVVAAREPHEAPADPDAEKAARKDKKRAAKAEAERAEREAALEERVAKLEKRLSKLKRRVEWLG